MTTHLEFSTNSRMPQREFGTNSMVTTVDTLRRLVEINKQIKEKFKNIVDEKQGIETHLAKIYEPITTAQESTQKAVEETGKKTVGAIEEQKNASRSNTY